VSQKELDERTLSLSKGETIALDNLTQRLRELGFGEVDYVYEPGQFAMRGSIVDVYSYSSEHPYRLDFFDDEIEKADEEFAPLSEAIEKEENTNSHTERSIRHGDYEETLSPRKKRKGSLSGLGKELEEAFDNDDYSGDEYDDDREEEANNENDDLEPTDEELMDIDSDFYLQKAEIPPEERARMEAEQAPAKPKRGRPRKDASAAPAVPATPKKKGRPRKSPAPEE
jgi:hypothetical protein